MVRDSATVAFKRARQVRETEGWIALLTQASRSAGRCVFHYGRYYLYRGIMEDTVNAMNEVDLLPDVAGLTAVMVASNQQADELAADGLDLRSCVIGARERLGRGTVAACIFVGGELAHVSWAALTEQGREGLKEPPYRLGFANNEVCIADAWTHPQYRRRGLALYAGYKLRQFLWGRGRVIERCAVERGNAAIQGLYARLGPGVVAEARYLKVLWWQSWREWPVGRATPVPRRRCRRWY